MHDGVAQQGSKCLAQRGTCRKLTAALLKVDVMGYSVDGKEGRWSVNLPKPVPVQNAEKKYRPIGLDAN